MVERAGRSTQTHSCAVAVQIVGVFDQLAPNIGRADDATQIVVGEIHRTVDISRPGQSREFVVAIVRGCGIGIGNLCQPVQRVVGVIRRHAVVICALNAIADLVINKAHRHTGARHRGNSRERVVSKHVALTQSIHERRQIRARVVFIPRHLRERISNCDQPIRVVVSEICRSAGSVGPLRNVSNCIICQSLKQRRLPGGCRWIENSYQPIEIVVLVVDRARKRISNDRQIRHGVVTVTGGLS